MILQCKMCFINIHMHCHAFTHQMVFYAGHDDTNFGMFTALGQPIPDQWPYFASHFEFELWKMRETGNMLVRFFINLIIQQVTDCYHRSLTVTRHHSYHQLLLLMVTLHITFAHLISLSCWFILVIFVTVHSICFIQLPVHPVPLIMNVFTHPSTILTYE